MIVHGRSRSQQVDRRGADDTSARALPVTQTVMRLPGAGFLRGRRTRGSFTAASAARSVGGEADPPHIGRDTRPPPPRRLMGAAHLRRVVSCPRDQPPTSAYRLAQGRPPSPRRLMGGGRIRRQPGIHTKLRAKRQFSEVVDQSPQSPAGASHAPSASALGSRPQAVGPGGGMGLFPPTNRKSRTPTA